MKVIKNNITMELSMEEIEILKRANKIWDEIVDQMAETDTEIIVDDEIEIISKYEIEDFLNRTTDLLDITTLELI